MTPGELATLLALVRVLVEERNCEWGSAARALLTIFGSEPRP